jgi:hypothetical protein
LSAEDHIDGRLARAGDYDLGAIVRIVHGGSDHPPLVGPTEFAPLIYGYARVSSDRHCVKE